tara:strand:- start:514 stop:1047 length:534 start_codon:yes stop_codon:yes gene_type:complete
MNIHKPIILIGMMGAGKTHIGRMLAQNLSLSFYDSDKVIEEKAAMSIPEIFTRFGEEKFRSSESSTIKQLIEQGASVIATGGGAILDEQSFSYMKDNAIVIWVRAPLDLIWERVKTATHRPLLQEENPYQKLQDIYAAREHLYQQAPLIFENHGHATQEEVKSFINLLSAHINEANV